MKKFFLILLCTTLLISFVGCSNIVFPESGTSEYADIPDGPYIKQTADWPIYTNATELSNASDIVLIGRVKSIEFKVLDITNSLPPSNDTPEKARTLYTIYNIEVLNVYKGETIENISVRIMGGMVNYKVDEQISVMNDGFAFNREKGIPVWDNYYKAQCSVNKCYLFALKVFATGLPTILNLEQAVFSLEEPTRKHNIGNSSVVYYSGSIDELGNPLISALDIISSFGNTEKKKFEQNWKNNIYN